MDIEWRTIQFFVDNETLSVSEVSVDAMNSKKVKCDCHKFMKMARCKHVKFVRERMQTNGGVFNLVIPSHVDDEEAIDALQDTELFRELILKYGRIEVL